VIEIVTLAATVVGKFLIPLLMKGKDKLTEDLADKGADAASGALVETAESLWQRIKKRFDRDDEKQAVGLFERNPGEMEKMMLALLEKRLTDDAEFRSQLSDLVEKPVEGTGQTAWQLMGKYVGAVDARGATISGGNVAGVIVSSPTPTPQPGSPPSGTDK
jgi:hypothetical protein